MEEPHAPKISPLLVMGFGILAVSTGSIFARFAQTNAPSLVIAAYRLTLATIFLSPFILLRHRNELVRLTRADLLFGLLSGFLLALHFATWITSLEYTTVASSVLFVSTTPLWVALFSPLTLKEHLPRRSLVGMGITVIGGIIVGLSDVCNLTTSGVSCPAWTALTQGRAFWGNFLALVGAWMAAGYLMIGRRLRPKLSLFGYIYVVYGMAASTLLLIAILTGQVFFGYPPQIYVWFIMLALIPQLLGHSSFNYALAYVPAALVAVVLLGEPVASGILAFFILNEPITLLKGFGATLTLAGIYLVSKN
jgi:drug/metabolite transporter (DMT)-like permease